MNIAHHSRLFLAIVLLCVVFHIAVRDAFSGPSRGAFGPWVGWELGGPKNDQHPVDKDKQEDDEQEDDDDEDDDDEDRIEHQMEELHEGKKSPFRRLQRAVGGAPPNWQVVNKQLPGFVQMSKLLQQARDDEIRDSADGYVEAVEELVRSARGRQLEATQKAFAALAESCADCHFKGGVGGELD